MQSIDIGEKVKQSGMEVDFNALCGNLGKPCRPSDLVAVATPEPAKFQPYTESFIPTIRPIRRRPQQCGMANVVLEMDSMMEIDIWKKKKPNPIPTKDTRVKLRTKNRIKTKQQAKDRKKNR